MTIDLTKRTSQLVDLGSLGLHQVFVRFRWNATPAGAAQLDCDLSAVMLTSDHALPGREYFVFYNNLVSGDGAVRHLGDHREAIGGAHGELIQIDLARVAPEVCWILVVVSIHDAAERDQLLGDLQSGLTTLHGTPNGPILHAHAIPSTAEHGDSCILARISPNADGQWTYEAVAEPFVGGLSSIRTMYYKG